ncbi:MAG TPA: biotin--[acetyl-CoA-carboxylase] ligase [Acidimicrobiales bacterium]|nr:biotin--[acetyl-CoA-carboxylase] ligase [Acidimicrobiales bacterium]
MRVDDLVLDEHQLLRLSGARFSRTAQYSEVSSTNTLALEEARRGAPEGLVVVADHQTAGRGRFDRRWEAPPSSSLLFSVLARPGEAGLPADRRHLAVAALSLAIAQAAAHLVLKWPNDLLVAAGPLAGRKAAGILAEGGPDDALVIGAGVNVHWAPEGAASLDEVARSRYDRGELLVSTLVAFSDLYGDWEEVARRYRRACSTLGREVAVSFAGGEPELRGTAVGVDELGRLLVRPRGEPSAERRVVAVAAGDVRHAAIAPTPRVQ